MSINGKDVIQYTLTTAQTTDGDMQHQPILTADFRFMVVTLKGTGGAAFTVNFLGSDESKYALPTFFTPLEVKDESSATFYAGSYTFAGDATIKVELNQNEVVWFKINMSGHASGQLDATITLANNL